MHTSGNIDGGTPVVATERAVQGITGSDDSRQAPHLLLKFAVAPGQVLLRQTYEGVVQVNDIAVVALKSEVLMF